MRRELSFGHCWEMLRITIADTPSEQKWVLAGRLTKTCVDQLRANWKESRSARAGRSCLVDLRDVTFIDESGEKVLRKMMDEGAQFLCRGVYTTQVVGEMEKEHRRGLASKQ